MAEAKGRRIAAADFVSKIVKDPRQPPNTLLLKGYLGDSSEEGYTRLYLDPQLSDYVEIPNDAILHTQDAADEQSPLGGSYVWIQRDAEIIHGRVGSDRLKAKFLEGRIYQENIKGAQFGGAGFPAPAPSLPPQFCPPPPVSQPWGCPVSLPPPCPVLSAYCPSHYHPLCPPSQFPPLCPPPTLPWTGCPPPTPGSPQCPPSQFPPQCPTNFGPPSQCGPCFTPGSPQCPQSVFQPQCPTNFGPPSQCGPCLTPGSPQCPTNFGPPSQCGPCFTPGSPQCPQSVFQPQCPTNFGPFSQCGPCFTPGSPQCPPPTLRGCPSAFDACPSALGCGNPGGFPGGGFR